MNNKMNHEENRLLIELNEKLKDAKIPHLFANIKIGAIPYITCFTYSGDSLYDVYQTASSLKVTKAVFNKKVAFNYDNAEDVFRLIMHAYELETSRCNQTDEKAKYNRNSSTNNNIDNQPDRYIFPDELIMLNLYLSGKSPIMNGDTLKKYLKHNNIIPKRVCASTIANYINTNQPNVLKGLDVVIRTYLDGIDILDCSFDPPIEFAEDGNLTNTSRIRMHIWQYCIENGLPMRVFNDTMSEFYRAAKIVQYDTYKYYFNE